mmetsp:Transcript_41754/g.103021  ORF Transcript_41754/g.103021 Transcript_41754/m.103021 type:complete len:225 (-) Transcript_41754:845-1519(-)
MMTLVGSSVKPRFPSVRLIFKEYSLRRREADAPFERVACASLACGFCEASRAKTTVTSCSGFGFTTSLSIFPPSGSPSIRMILSLGRRRGATAAKDPAGSISTTMLSTVNPTPKPRSPRLTLTVSSKVSSVRLCVRLDFRVVRPPQSSFKEARFRVNSDSSTLAGNAPKSKGSVGPSASAPKSFEPAPALGVPGSELSLRSALSCASCASSFAACSRAASRICR